MKDNEVKVIKLVTGEEIIAYTEVYESTLILKYPILLVPYEDGQIAFSPFIPAGVTNEVRVSRIHAMFDPIEPQPEFKVNYIETVKNIIEIEQQDHFIVGDDSIIM